MQQKKLLVVVGTRPEAIKLSPLIRLLQQSSDFGCEVVSTGQHRDLIQPIFDLFGIRPQVDLALMRQDQSLEEIGSHLLQLFPPVLQKHRPHLLIVQGDTSSAFFAALCGYYQKIPVAHVEAGLRTFDPWNPFPEEVNRRLLSSVATLHFAPTELNKQNLLRERISEERIHVTGNTVIDALLQISSSSSARLPEELKGLDGKRVILVTTHRRENFGEPLKEICGALEDLTLKFPDLEIVIPLHPNPHAGPVISQSLSGMKNIRLIQPLAYEPFVQLMKLSTIILTDSGGLQEEAPALKKPVLVLRNATERQEAIQAGTARLVGTERKKIVEEASHLLQDSRSYESMVNSKNPYGDGRASLRILEILKDFPLP